MSVAYLSEVERGRKEASSEVLAAVCRALGLRLVDLVGTAHAQLALAEGRRRRGPDRARGRRPGDLRRHELATVTTLTAPRRRADRRGRRAPARRLTRQLIGGTSLSVVTTRSASP